MNVLLISQCNKNALTNTRRILDQFAERKGERTWQTAITQAGLNTLRIMLRKTARRNTAVACHWIKSANRTELLWIVGNLSKFNENGTIPTNTTRRNILKTQDENSWHTIEDIAIITGLAGLFHDFGKANDLFQDKIKHKSKSFEPFRHEWLSLRLFQAFVGDKSDKEWIEKLLNLEKLKESDFLDNLIKDKPGQESNPFKKMTQPLAQIVGWLIVAHHRLPVLHYKHEAYNLRLPLFDKTHKWFKGMYFEASKNSPQIIDNKWTAKELGSVWNFKKRLPVISDKWQSKAKSIAKRALRSINLCKNDWLSDFFSMHIARLSLMMADHVYSSGESDKKWSEQKYRAYANTDRKTGLLKQKLDEHLIGVAHNAFLFSKTLPILRRELPAITRHKGLTKRTSAKFRWQDKAFELATSLKQHSQKNGFFGVNMASTGAGKTFANARIMYGLSDGKLGCRFNIALGLRTLTLQTGDSMRERLHLAEDDLAVMIGSQAVKQLHSMDRNIPDQHEILEDAIFGNSESRSELLDINQYVSYEGSLLQGRLGRWFKINPNLHRLVSCPVLVSTIDYLMPATESGRGGHQIAPMLRLLTSDLVLDEPDDFSLEDLPALSRLVNWAGMLGSKVLLSSATLPPDLIQALFESYLNGRVCYQNSCSEPNLPINIACAWIDENRSESIKTGRLTDFMAKHQEFVVKRVKKLRQEPPIRKARLLAIKETGVKAETAVSVMSKLLYETIPKLHENHNQLNTETGNKVSFGLIRMANINPLVAVARELFSMEAPQNYNIHFVVYHSKHPLAVRSAMESELDSILQRHDENSLWKNSTIIKAIKNSSEKNHVFIVLATSVAEVGRDHDYDWAIVEPSSMRSFIQLAGRIQRHRKQLRPEPNIYILAKNFKGLCGKDVAFDKPGFENKVNRLTSHDLNEILEKEQFEIINAIPRIQKREKLKPKSNMVDLEHFRLNNKLLNSNFSDKPAKIWWQTNINWTYELQRVTPFRKSIPDEKYILYFEDEGEEPNFCLVNQDGSLTRRHKSNFDIVEFTPGKGMKPWLTNDYNEIICELSEKTGLSLAKTCRKFGEIKIRKGDNSLYNKILGVHLKI